MNLKSKKTRNVSGLISCFFYVLYIAIHFFSNKMIACVKEFDFFHKKKLIYIAGIVLLCNVQV